MIGRRSSLNLKELWKEDRILYMPEMHISWFNFSSWNSKWYLFYKMASHGLSAEKCFLMSPIKYLRLNQGKSGPKSMKKHDKKSESLCCHIIDHILIYDICVKHIIIVIQYLKIISMNIFCSEIHRVLTYLSRAIPFGSESSLPLFFLHLTHALFPPFLSSRSR